MSKGSGAFYVDGLFIAFRSNEMKIGSENAKYHLDKNHGRK